MSGLPNIDLIKLRPAQLSPNLIISAFDCGDTDLNDFLKNDALKYQEAQIAQTTCLDYEGQVIGFYTLCCDSIRLKKNEKRGLIPHLKRGYEDYPALKIVRMGISKEQEKGSHLFN